MVAIFSAITRYNERPLTSADLLPGFVYTGPLYACASTVQQNNKCTKAVDENQPQSMTGNGASKQCRISFIFSAFLEGISTIDSSR